MKVLFTDDGSYDVILTNLTWRVAQDYCRKNGADLARVRNQIENKAVQEVLNGNRSPFWIGLFQDGFKWSDQSDSSFRYWQYTQPNNDGPCVLYDPANHYWWDRPCGQQFPFFCYNGELFGNLSLRQYKMLYLCKVKWNLCLHSTAITVTRWMTLEMKSNSSVYFSDPKTSAALLDQASVKSA